MTFGWLCGELVRRVDGRSVGRFLREEIAESLGVEVWIGLPECHEHRVAVLERGAAFGNDHDDSAARRDVDPVAWSIWSNPPRFADGELAADQRRWHAAEIPATERDRDGTLAGAPLPAASPRAGEIGGVRLLSPETVEMGRRCLARGNDPCVGAIAFATGFQVQTSEMRLGPAADAFGHGGAGGSMHGAWPSLRTGFSYAPNLLASLSSLDPRANALLGAMHTAVVNRM